MTTLCAGTPVKRGYYFSIDRWSVNPIANDGAALHGELGERFVPVPLAVAVVLAPVLGAVFLMFMPFIGFYLTAQAAVRPLARFFQASTAAIAASFSPGMHAGEAHLAGRDGNARTGAAGFDVLDALQREIAERRASRR